MWVTFRGDLNGLIEPDIHIAICYIDVIFEHQNNNISFDCLFILMFK